MTNTRDVVIVGGGHNALVAAAYLARAGRTVTVLERLDHVGGAAVSERPWAGVDARLSRYSYLVSLLPRRVIDDLGLEITLKRRRYSSYTPAPEDPARGILVDRGDEAATVASFARTTGSAEEAARFAAFYDRLAPLATTLFPTVTDPLPRERDVRAAIGDDDLFDAIAARPLGELLRDSFETDIARGIAFTDGLIGTFATADEPSLRQNRCFLYHVIGGGTGDWDVPVGGMGTVSGELRRAALRAGAELRTGTEATGIDPDGSVRARGAGDEELAFAARWVLAGCSPTELARLLGEAPPPAPEGAQVKVNLLLQRLPRLRERGVDPRAAFGGTFHVNETWTQLETAYHAAASGAVPEPLPLEIYCHSLTDPTILSEELRDAGAHTITVFGLHTPHRLAGTPTYSGGIGADRYRARLQEAVLESLDSVLAEPVEELLRSDAEGRPTIETKTTIDLERGLRLPGGDIFHGPLSWPWAEDDEPLATPAERWGVATGHERVLLCGSGARRGGAVSAIGGHNAAMAVLESL